MQTNANIVVSLINNSLEIYDGLLSKNIKKKDVFELLKTKEDLDRLRLPEVLPRRKEKMLKELTKEKYLDELEISEVRPTLDAAYKYVSSSKAALLKGINESKEISEKAEAELKDAIDEFLKINKK